MAKHLPSVVKICRVISRLNIGGPAIHVTLLTKRLNEVPFHSFLVAGEVGASEGSMEWLAYEQGLSVTKIPHLGREISLLSDWSTLLALFRLFRQEKPMILHTHTSKAGTLGRLAAKAAGVPVIVHTFHGHVFSGYFSARKTRIFGSIERILGYWTDAIVAISPSQRTDLLNLGIGSSQKVRVIPLGFELRPFLEASGTTGLRHRFGLSRGDKLVGIVGRLTPIKNHRLFIDAAKILAEQDNRVRFVIIGDGELRADLEAYVRQARLDNRVFFTGWVRDMPGLFRDLDLVVQTSTNEGTPVSVIEAMASARPVVATAVGGVPDVISNGETGLLVPPGNVGMLAEAMQGVLADEALAHRLGQAAREQVAAKYDIERLLNDTIDLYCNLLRAKGYEVPIPEGSC